MAIFLVLTNKAKRLLYVGFIQRVKPEEIRRELASAAPLLGESRVPKLPN